MALFGIADQGTKHFSSSPSLPHLSHGYALHQLGAITPSPQKKNRDAHASNSHESKNNHERNGEYIMVGIEEKRMAWGGETYLPFGVSCCPWDHSHDTEDRGESPSLPSLLHPPPTPTPQNDAAVAASCRRVFSPHGGRRRRIILPGFALSGHSFAMGQQSVRKHICAILRRWSYSRCIKKFAICANRP